MSRYMGNETAISPLQVIKYLQENYVDPEGDPMTESVAREIAEQSADEITRGITVFKSNVEYLGDEAIKKAKVENCYLWLETDEYEEVEEEDDDG